MTAGRTISDSAAVSDAPHWSLMLCMPCLALGDAAKYLVFVSRLFSLAAQIVQFAGGKHQKLGVGVGGRGGRRR